MKMRKRRIAPKSMEAGDNYFNGKAKLTRMDGGKLHLVDPSTGEKFSVGVYSWILWRWK